MRNPAVNLEGVVAIPVTPFQAGEIDLDAYRKVLDRIIDAGIRTLTPNGNTSEFYALRPAERRLLLEVTCEHVAGRATVLAGVGLDIETAVSEARIAEQHGATMIMVHQPVHPYVSASGWLDYHAAIADAVPSLGVVLYIRNTWVDGELIRALASRCANIIGVKYAVNDPVRFAAVRAGAPQLSWIAGLAEPYALSYFAHGAVGFTSGLVSVNPWLSVDLLNALRAGDYETARSLTARIAEFEELRAAAGSADNVSVVKEALAQLGLTEREIRPPSSAVSSSAAARIGAILQDWSTDYDLAPAAPVAVDA